MKKSIKTIIFYNAIIICMSSCKPEDVNIIPIKPDYRDSLVGEYPHGLFQAYSCYRDTGYTGIFGVEREHSVRILVQKYDSNGLEFFTSNAIEPYHSSYRIYDIGQLKSPIINGEYELKSNGLYIKANKDSILLRFTPKSIPVGCSNPLEQITSKK